MPEPNGYSFWSDLFSCSKSYFTMVLLDEEADPQLTCLTVPLWQQDPPQGEADLT